MLNFHIYSPQNNNESQTANGKVCKLQHSKERRKCFSATSQYCSKGETDFGVC